MLVHRRLTLSRGPLSVPGEGPAGRRTELCGSCLRGGACDGQQKEPGASDSRQADSRHIAAPVGGVWLGGGMHTKPAVTAGAAMRPSPSTGGRLDG